MNDTATIQAIAASPKKLRDGSWGAKIEAQVEIGSVIAVETRSGKSWRARVRKIVWTNGTTSIVETDRIEDEAPRSAAHGARIGDLGPILTMFAKAAEHLKRPAVVLACELGERGAVGELRLTPGKAGTRYDGAVHISSNDDYEDRIYFGRILQDGTFFDSPKRRGNQNMESLVGLLRRFAAEPAEVAAEHGKLTGRCCFCNRGLTDERSTAVGYGPVAPAALICPGASGPRRPPRRPRLSGRSWPSATGCRSCPRAN